MDKKKLREQIIGAEDLAPVPVKIHEWDIEAFVRPLDGESRFRISQLAATADHKKQNSYIAEAYVCEGLVTEDGEQIFLIEDRALLAKKNPAVIERLYKEVVRVSGMSAGDEGDAEKK